jgi:hypothetical protein
LNANWRDENKLFVRSPVRRAATETGAGQPAAGGTPDRRDDVMKRLQALLQAQFEPLDASATVQVSESHRGANNKLVELVTTLQDEQIASALTCFCEAHGVTITALE